jgi:SAM-dependent methyltransferase
MGDSPAEGHRPGIGSMSTTVPIPPIEFRRLVGLPDERFFDGSIQGTPFDHLPSYCFDSVLDFGCGIGRLAASLIRRPQPPRRYLGIDRHKGMIDWCRANLSPLAPEFYFEHHNVFHEVLNAEGTPGHLPLPAGDGSVTLFIAWSVFTHLLEEDAKYYLHELNRVMGPRGIATTTWFLFDKGDFPMMQEFQNALMINPRDPTNAVIFDRNWLVRTAAEAGLTITSVTPPEIRGFHWIIYFERTGPGRVPAEFPPDLAPRDIARPPLG